MGELKKYKEQVMTAVSKSTKKQKIIFFSVVGLVLLGLVFFITWIGQTEYSVLYSDLSADDAGEIVTKLKEGKVDYKLTEGGATIMVPAEKVYELRLELAAQDLPRNGTVGLEIFDKTNFGKDKFTEKMDYQRAIQGELSRTINQLQGVEDSRVHLAIPEKRLLTEMEKEPTASVVLYMAPGKVLSHGQIQGILHLISSSVEGLKPENISILDNFGKILTLDDENEEKEKAQGEIIAKYYELKGNLERHLSSKVQSLLNKVVGEDRAEVEVSVEINMDQKEINKETYIPIKGNVGVLRSEQVLEEKYKGEGSAPSGSGSIAETTDQNTPSYPAVEESEGKNNDYKRSESISNYEVSTEKSKETDIPGDIKHISVGVVVDENLALSPEAISGIKDIVAGAIGYKEDRGDIIKVAAIPFITTSSEESAPAGEEEKIGGTIPIKYVYYLLAFIALAIIIAVIASKKKVKEAKEISAMEAVKELESKKDREAIEDKSMAQTGEGAEKKKPEELEITLDTERLSLEDKYRNKIIEEYLENVKTLANEKPGDVAVLFRVWMNEDD